MKNRKPIIGISMGDPAGIGPEITAKTLATRDIYDICRPLIIGDANAMRDAVKIAQVDLEIHPVTTISEGRFDHGTADVFDLKNVDMDELEHGKISAMAGNAAFHAVKRLIELALDKEIDATVTGPIHKESINLAGHHYPGHT
ncbi:MAG: 4-hydroxythreonine-4-phosphate dehydrogenase PdxA, partial [candidate division KSB1 bacterium]|nr:4-hydroxythreonine-4-phosphate dehydrogenase PdxA [candidate division KSB1 bacterium]